jgi:hypothetical protein
MRTQMKLTTLTEYDRNISKGGTAIDKRTRAGKEIIRKIKTYSDLQSFTVSDCLDIHPVLTWLRSKDINLFLTDIYNN